ncbi:PSD1 and planctomycete cytochrome C domain-containing protein [Anatilimnocola floriformis]|uniref:PSD1 and planctomycete cytochrome C domain-containing protein n=1 Tax=Anatilimnocola floriformis TaxID=2948575 RepID=UPI0020C3CBC7|nr:PSD1 and planctomycete cytochrome C domain-containing protein [Anatilimnocola floriformis]
MKFSPLCLLPLFAVSLSAAEPVDYLRDIKPVIQAACVKCHGKLTQKSDLKLDTAAAAIAGGVSGPSIVPGKSAESIFIQTIEGKHDYVPKMPYKRPPLDAAQVALLKRWIDEGAKAPADEQPSDDRHWAFIAPKKAPLPDVGVKHPIDAFVVARLKQDKLELSSPAAKHTLIRRLYLDLLGLPPTPAQVAAFVADDSPQAWERAVDQVLESPHYGERWGRWWLDQARYADSNGYSIDAPRQIWKYRDWVVSALNRDLPFDQFTVEQLAGDLLADATEPQKIATGFHRNTQINQEGGIDPEQFRIESVIDRVGTTGTVWLGLTIACAQCHDHKFDPISHKEYYQLFAFFNNQSEPTLRVIDGDVDPKEVDAEIKELEQKLKAYFKKYADDYAKWEEELGPMSRSLFTPEATKAIAIEKKKRSFEHTRALFQVGPGAADQDYRAINERYLELVALQKGGVTTMVMEEMKQPRKTTIFLKGDFTRPDAEVTEGVPAVLPPLKTEKRPNRLQLANWLVTAENPLTARVIVNRVWQQYFGRGLVETENDFGTMGSPPTHPELLDWLAVDFRDNGWSLKKLHKLIVTSDTYRQSSTVTPQSRGLVVDPKNYLLWRQTRLRLDAEIVRDVSLAASGLLAEKQGGPPVYPPIPEGVLGLGQVKRPWPLSKGDDRYRRGLYTFVFRATPPPSLSVFDAPEGFSTCTRRIRSNTPLQALSLLNDAAHFEFAQSLEKVIQKDGLVVAFERCVSRPPTMQEKELLSKLDTLSQARVLLNLDETITRE